MGRAGENLPRRRKDLPSSPKVRKPWPVRGGRCASVCVEQRLRAEGAEAALEAEGMARKGLVSHVNSLDFIPHF